MRYLSILAFITISFSTVYAQTAGVEITPLSNNYFLSIAKQPVSVRNAASLEMPFVDDFSYNGPYPDSRLWVDKNVFVNYTMAGNAPSLGAATFDGIDGKGRPYSAIDVYGTCDTLTSQPINLSGSTGRGIHLSYHYQPKGLCFAPTPNDSLVLEFKNASGTWVSIKNYPGLAKSVSLDLVPPFTFESISIDDARFLHANFQFRFYTYGRRGGAYSQWQLDYVRLDKDGNANKNTFRDIAFAELPKPILKRYTAMPWKQARAQVRESFQDTASMVIINNFDVELRLPDDNSSITASTGQKIVTRQRLTGNSDTVFFKSKISKTTQPLSYLQGTPAFFTNIEAISAAETAVTFTNQIWLQSPQVQSSGDLTKAAIRNDTIVYNTICKDYYAYDDGTAEMQLTARGLNQQTAIQFVANVSDTLRGVRFFFPHINGDALPTTLFNILVWKDSLKTTPIYVKRNLKPYYLTDRADTLQGFTSYSIDTVVVIPKGKFFVGWQLVGDVQIPIGLDRNNRDKSANLFFINNGNWESITDALGNVGTVMVRPVFNRIKNSSDLTAIPDIALANVMNIYPNPANGYLNFDLKEGLESDYSVSIFNVAGQLQKQEILRGGQISLMGFNAGLYFLKIQDLKNNRVFNHKFVVAR